MNRLGISEWTLRRWVDRGLVFSRTRLDDLLDREEAAGGPDPHPHAHFHHHGGRTHAHQHAHTDVDYEHAHSHITTLPPHPGWKS